MMTTVATVSLSSPTRLLRIADVKTMTGLSGATIYRWISKHQFPQAIELSPGCVRWFESEIEAWIQEKASARRP